MKKIDNNEKVNNPIEDKDLKELLGVQKFNYGEIEEENNWCGNRISLDGVGERF